MCIYVPTWSVSQNCIVNKNWIEIKETTTHLKYPSYSFCKQMKLSSEVSNGMQLKYAK